MTIEAHKQILRRIEKVDIPEYFLPFEHCFIHADYLNLFHRHGIDRLRRFMDYPTGKTISRKRGRTVIQIELERKIFYIKRNRIQFHEFLKRLTRFQFSNSGARQEVQNIFIIEGMGIKTVPVVAFGERKLLGIELESFVATEKLYGYRPLEDIVQENWKPPLSREQIMKKRHLIVLTANLARQFHEQGLNHQDFYLGHFFVHPEKAMAIIDVQRVQQRSRIPLRYRLKDLGQLYYSVLFTGNISRTDCMRFFHVYVNKNHLSQSDKQLIRKITLKMKKIDNHTVKLLERRRNRGEIQ